MKAILIGRHVPSGNEGIEIVGDHPRPIMFPATSEECYAPLHKLVTEAAEKDCKLLFQAVPWQVSIALENVVTNDTRFNGIVGAVVSIPGPRLTAVTTTFAHDDPAVVGHVESVIRFVNSRATIEEISPYEIKISVDPFSPFVFSHIQWLDGGTSNWSIRGFFARFGLPMEWLEGENIVINEDDNNVFPDVNNGDEVWIDRDDNIYIDGKEISIRAVSSPGNFKEFFSDRMEIGSGEDNVRKLIRLINEAKDHETDCVFVFNS